MKRLYEEPEIQIRNYALHTKDIITTSDDVIDPNPDPDLNDGDDYDYFG